MNEFYDKDFEEWFEEWVSHIPLEPGEYLRLKRYTWSAWEAAQQVERDKHDLMEDA